MRPGSATRLTAQRANGVFRRVALLALLLTLVSSAASAYYHWIYYVSRSGNFVPIFRKFDLSQAPNQTIPFFISKQGPEPMVEGDNFPALISQIRRAAETWNQAPTAAIKLGFGGMGEIGIEQKAPGIDVVFDDEMPPGVLAQSWPQTVDDLSFLAAEVPEGGATPERFAPIVRARLQLRKNLAERGQASFSEAFFMTMVHEFGHTMGLQHSLTSATMSTAITRATSKAQPLSPDDIAGLSLLYPTERFRKITGVIAGRVQADGEGVNLASVVALSKTGTAISALTNPDGTYRIEGLPPGEYYVYAHPLPPALSDETNRAGIYPPFDLTGEPFVASGSFETKFYPGTRNWQEATAVGVAARQTVDAIDFNLARREMPAIHSMRTFGYFGNEARGVYYVHAPPMRAGVRNVLVVKAPGTVEQAEDGSAAMLPGLAVSEIGSTGGVDGSTLHYWQDGFLLVNLEPPVETAVEGAAPPAPRAKPVALAFTTADDLYVLPDAFQVTPSGIPEITQVEQNRDGQGVELARLTGVNLGDVVEVLFDGAPALSMSRDQEGTLLVAAPPAADQHLATISLLDRFGQSSSQLTEGLDAPKFRYDVHNETSLSARPGDVTAGTDTMLEISGHYTDFLDGLTEFGFGTSDIQIQQQWVMNRDLALLNVSVKPGAQTGPVTVTAVTGLEVAKLDTVMLVHAPEEGQASLHAPVTNLATGLAGVPAGGIARIPATGVPAGHPEGWTLTIGGIQAPFEVGEDGALLATLSPGVALGPAIVELRAPGQSIPRILMHVDEQPPTILSVGAPDALSASAPPVYRAGESVSVTAQFLTGSFFGPLPTEDVEIVVGGVIHQPAKIEAVGPLGQVRIDFVLSDEVPAGEEPTAVRIGTRVSNALPITVAEPGQ